MIAPGFVQDLLTRVNIVDVIGRYVQLKKGGQNYLGLCPFHGEKTPSFTVSPSKQFFHCFGCGAHGSAIGFLMDQRGLDFVEAVGELAQQVGMRVPEVAGANTESTQRVRGLTEVLERASAFYAQQLRESPSAIEYLKQRRVTGETARRFALGFAPEPWQSLRAAVDSYDDPRLVEAGLVIAGDQGKRFDRFRDRIMFPIRNRRGSVIGFGARIIGAGEPKYLNSPETPLFHKGQEVYGLHEAQEAIRTRKRALVCEGYMDVIQLSQAGFAEAVATLGTAISGLHVGALLRLTDHVIFAFDGDAAGRKAARRALEATLPVLGDTKRASFVLLPEGEDPDSLIRERGTVGFDDQMENALPLSRYLLQELARGRDLKLPEDRSAMLAEARPLLASMAPGLLRSELARELADVIHARADDLEADLGLKRWRRLPPGRDLARPALRSAPVADLKARILQHLIAYPGLARDFNAQIVAACDGGGSVEDQRIVEVWRAATSARIMTTGALLEAIGDSDNASAYRALASGELLYDDDLSAARADLAGGFAKLELARVEVRRQELAQLIQSGGDESLRREYSALNERHAALKRAAAASSLW
jgi:DNA primase